MTNMARAMMRTKHLATKKAHARILSVEPPALPIDIIIAVLAIGVALGSLIA